MNQWEELKSDPEPPPVKPFNLIAFFFAPFYYIGYGQYLRGLVFMLVSLVPVLALGVSVYAGFRANRELPIGQRPFDWRAVFLGAVGYLAILTFMLSQQSKPAPNGLFSPSVEDSSLTPGFSPELYCNQVNRSARTTCMDLETKAKLSLPQIEASPQRWAICKDYARGSNQLLVTCLRTPQLPQI